MSILSRGCKQYAYSWGPTYFRQHVQLVFGAEGAMDKASRPSTGKTRPLFMWATPIGIKLALKPIDFGSVVSQAHLDK